MSRRKAQGRLIHYDDRGRETRASERVYATLCTGEDPQIFVIELRDKRITRFRAIYIRRTAIEQVLEDNPAGRRRG